MHDGRSTDEDSVTYEPPELTVIGSAADLTQGPTTGPQPDAVLHTAPMHISG
jgi:hypothetical protein